MDIAVGAVLYGGAAYMAAGLVLLVPMHRRLLPRLDESADGATWGFHVLVSPGLVALWPVMLWKWMRRRAGADAHGCPDAMVSAMRIRRTQFLFIKLLAVTLPLLVAAAIAARTAPPPPVELPALTQLEK